jgi:hypothetical protein
VGYEAAGWLERLMSGEPVQPGMVRTVAPSALIARRSSEIDFGRLRNGNVPKPHGRLHASPPNFAERCLQ